jgi:hypothetical protein
MNKKPKKIFSKGIRKNWIHMNDINNLKITDEVIKKQTVPHNSLSKPKNDGDPKFLIP